MKEDRYEFPASEWESKYYWASERFVLTRKKPRVKVEWSGGGYGLQAIYDEYGQFYIVQFRVTGSLNSEYVYSYRDKGLMALLTPNCTVSSFNLREPVTGTDVLHIATDAHSKWSTPVLLPERVYSRLDEICRALEDKANEGVGW